MQPPTRTVPDKIEAAFKIIKNELDQVKKLINRQLAGCSDKIGIERLFERIGVCSGKMLRPGLVLLSYRAVKNASYDGRPKLDTTAAASDMDVVIRIAAIIEMIHNAALLHDDVIDEGQKRRGAPTINNLWGNAYSVLLGDFLLSRVFKMCVGLQPTITAVIADAVTRTCEGELRQTIQSRNWQISESEYIDIITEKSAVLFSSACRLGALLANADEARLQSLGSFGVNLGIAFQITDDLLDIIGDEAETGKTLGRDVDKNKLTLALIHLLKAADDSHCMSCISRIVGGDKKELIEMLKRYGSLEYVHSRTRQFVAGAIKSLTGLKAGVAKDALIKTAEFVGQRPAGS
jgi:octaprenyl-diphosphate synthase